MPKVAGTDEALSPRIRMYEVHNLQTWHLTPGIACCCSIMDTIRLAHPSRIVAKGFARRIFKEARGSVPRDRTCEVPTISTINLLYCTEQYEYVYLYAQGTQYLSRDQTRLYKGLPVDYSANSIQQPGPAVIPLIARVPDTAWMKGKAAIHSNVGS